MEFSLVFIMNSILLGVGLAMDAFSVSMANGLREPRMNAGRMSCIAGVYAFFQIAMPLIGWFIVSRAAEMFDVIKKFIPWISLGLLLFIGLKMVIEGVRGGDEEDDVKTLGFGTLVMQGIATSIDALSVGFTLAEYPTLLAISASLIIGLVTFIICFFGIIIGKKIGTKLSGKAAILGGIILIAIGTEIFLNGMFG